MPLAVFFLATMGLQYLTYMLRNSVWGIVSTFAFTGVLGYSLGPVLAAYLQLANGASIVFAALGLTGVVFFTLSGYALISKKDFSYLAGFLMAGIMVAFLASLLAVFFNFPLLQLAVTSGFVLLSSGFILYETSQLVNGGERNYILATIGLYVQIYNLFISLLRTLSIFSNRDR
jgi:modulator of FtsH protease